MHTWGPPAKARCRRAFGPPEVEAVRVGELLRVAVGARDGDGDQFAAFDRRVAEPDVAGRVAVDHRRRRLQPQRFLDRVRHQAGVGLDQRPLLGVGEQMEHRVGDHPLGRLDAAEHEHGRIGGDLLLGEPAGGLRQQRGAGIGALGRHEARAQLLERLLAGRRHRPARRHPGHRVHDGVVPGQDGCGARALDAEGPGDDPDGQGTGQAAAQLRAPRRLERVDEPVGLGRHRPREALADGLEAKRPHERIAVPGVLVAVEGEHARSHHPARGEARVVDREGGGVAHRPQREVAPGDEPCPERGQPRDRLVGAKPREQRVRIGLELLETGGGADRERVPPPIPLLGCVGHPAEVCRGVPDGGTVPSMPTLAQVEEVARGGPPRPLDAAERARIETARAVIEAAMASERPVYGVTTGFGQLASVRVPPGDAARLQVNLLRSHAVGAGSPLEEEVVRGMLLLLAGSLRRGHSGARVELVELVLALLERGVVPVVPSRGSVGSSGDLAPLAHLALVLIGEGEATVAGERMPGGQALAARGTTADRAHRQGGPRADQRHAPDGRRGRPGRPGRAAPAGRCDRRGGPVARGVQGVHRAVRRAAARGAAPARSRTRGRPAAGAPGRERGGGEATPTAAGCRTPTPCAARRR